MGLNNEEKINIINNMINNINLHISILDQDISLNPDDDVEGKRKRSDVLADLYSRKNALEEELFNIQDSGII